MSAARQSTRLQLPSGAGVVVRTDEPNGGLRLYHFPPGPMVLLLVDIEYLYADSIADDGGARTIREARAARRARSECLRTCSSCDGSGPRGTCPCAGCHR